MKPRSASIWFAIGFTALVSGCAGAPESTAVEGGTQATGPDLQALGVYSLTATGSAEDATITLFDKSAKVVGGGVAKTEGGMHAEINWKGVRWEIDAAQPVDTETSDAIPTTTLLKDGVLLNKDALTPAVQKDIDEAKNVLDLASEESKLPSHVAVAQACKKSQGICKLLGVRTATCCPTFSCVWNDWPWTYCRKNK